jgi:hypothetical protein
LYKQNGVPKEAQDDALSDGTSGGHQTQTGRPTRGDVAPMTVFILSRTIETHYLCPVNQ